MAKYTDEDTLDRVDEMLKDGRSYADISYSLEVSNSTVSRIKKRLTLPFKRGERWPLKKRQDIVARLLSGEAVAAVAAAEGVSKQAVYKMKKRCSW